MTKKLSPLQKSRKQLMGKTIRKLDGFSLDGARGYQAHSMHFNSFPQWTQAALNVEDTDLARAVLYFGFQPLFDALVGENASGNVRGSALKAYDQILERGMHYLTGYYTNCPNPQVIRTLAEETSGQFRKLKYTPFNLKFRNIDYNGIFPQDILTFLNKLCNNSLDGVVNVPEAVVGCACGSSEVAMAAAGILQLPLDFIRRSKRRGDSTVKTIPEREDALKKHVNGRHVICIEDYLCTGRSLREVMEKVKTYEPASVQGLSINHFAPDFSYSEGIKLVHQDNKFNVYSI